MYIQPRNVFLLFSVMHIVGRVCVCVCVFCILKPPFQILVDLHVWELYVRDWGNFQQCGLNQILHKQKEIDTSYRPRAVSFECFDFTSFPILVPQLLILK